MQQPVLTIAIPTYNRAGFLNTALNAIVTQLSIDIKDKIELIVFDNCSADNTSEVVNKYINNGFEINYYTNNENVGPDRNIANCYLTATGKYIWVFGDDDFILPGYLSLILNLLVENEFGVIYIKSEWYTDNYDKPYKETKALSYDVYIDSSLFVENTNYWLTFITGNIINKSLLTNYDNIAAFYGTNLVQLSWVLPAIFSAKQNAIIEDTLLACKAENTGGYKLFEVFAKNFNGIMDKLISQKLVEKKVKEIINTHLLQSFFPMVIDKKAFKFKKSEVFKLMLPLYWNYKIFWTNLFPMLIKKTDT